MLQRLHVLRMLQRGAGRRRRKGAGWMTRDDMVFFSVCLVTEPIFRTDFQFIPSGSEKWGQGLG
jgi:hypothetical protein